MKLVSSIIVAAIGSWVIGLVLPWWSIAILPFLLGIGLSLKTGQQALAGFLGIGLLWFILAMLAQAGNAHDLSAMIGREFGNVSGIVLVIITGVIGGLYGALAQLSGHFLGQLIKKK